MVTLSTGCKKDDESATPTITYDARVANEWMNLSIEMTKKTPGFSPPVAARAYAYNSIALYQAVALGSEEYESLEGKIAGLEEGDMPQPAEGQDYHWGYAANMALRTTFAHLYRNAPASTLDLIDSLSTVFYNEALAESTEEILEQSKAFGEDVGRAVIEYSKGDWQDQCFLTNFPSTYSVPNCVGCWKPTPPAFQAIPLQPYWGQVRTFVYNNVLQSLPPHHENYSEDPASQFYADANQVYQTVTNLTDEQLKIAKFWSDDPVKTGTPPGHSMSIARQVLEQENADLMLAAETYVRVGMSVHDAFVSCWKCKYDYNLLRPVTYIIQFIDPTFVCPLTTPPFPEYTSGHSVQSGASMQVLTDLFGDNYSFTDRTHENRTDIDGTPRTYNTFFEAADEAAISRLYGGIHYIEAIELGVDQGIKVGKGISAIPLKKL
jgi:hypothetical protein